MQAKNSHLFACRGTEKSFGIIFLRAVTCILILMLAINVYAQESCDSVRIHFRQGHTEIDTTLHDNRKALEQAMAWLSDDNVSGAVRFIRLVTVIGGASPEGGIAVNHRLSEQRAQHWFDYLSHYHTLPDSLRHTAFLGRDWTGLLRLTKASDKVPYKTEVVTLLYEIIDRIARSGRDSEENLVRLKRLQGGIPYMWLYKNLFPELRGSTLYICYDRMICPIETDSAICLPDSIIPMKVTTTFRSDTLPGTEVVMAASEKKESKPFCMAIKTNLLYDALLVSNIGAEFYLGRNWSVAGNWMYAWWKNDRKHNYWRTYGGDIGLRYWFGLKAKEKTLTGHHFGLYGQLFTYDFELGGRGYMGGKTGGTLWDKMNYAAGVEYGYSHPIARRLNLDFTLGIGYWGGTYHEYLPQDGHYVWQATKRRQWFGPTKTEISLVWLLGRENVNRKGGRQ